MQLPTNIAHGNESRLARDKHGQKSREVAQFGGMMYRLPPTETDHQLRQRVRAPGILCAFDKQIASQPLS